MKISRNTLCVLLCSVFVFLFIRPTPADHPDHGFTKYAVTQDGTKIELKDGVNLLGKNLRYNIISRGESQNLKNLIFGGAYLTGAILYEVNFIDCSFRSARLNHVYAREAEFSGCDFTGAYIPGATLKITKEQLLSTSSYSRKGFNGERVGKPELQSCHFFDTDFPDVDFTECRGKDLSFTRVDLRGCDFTRADLRGAFFLRSNLKDCVFEDADITGAGFNYNISDIFPGRSVGFVGKTREYVDQKYFSKEQLVSTASFKKKVLAPVYISGTDLTGVDFSTFNLTNGHFFTNMKDVDLTDAVITGCRFDFATNLTLEQVKSTWNYKVGRMDGIEFPKDIQEALAAEKKE